jgi:hypothetical protein
MDASFQHEKVTRTRDSDQIVRADVRALKPRPFPDKEEESTEMRRGQSG